MKRYEMVEHTADLGIRVYGRDLKELFVNAAVGMYEQIADLEDVQTKETFQVNLEAPNYEELLVLWLSELLAKNSIGQRLLKDFRIDRLDSNTIVSQAQGEPIDQARHRLKRELKAVTFHDVKIEKKDDIYSAQIIFDV